MKIKQEKSLETLIKNLQIASGEFIVKTQEAIKRSEDSINDYEKQMKEIREKYLA